jgi:hypothetical protein
MGAISVHPSWHMTWFVSYRFSCMLHSIGQEGKKVKGRGRGLFLCIILIMVADP